MERGTTSADFSLYLGLFPLVFSYSWQKASCWTRKMMISAHVCLRRSWSSRILHHTIDNEAVYTVRQTAPWPIRFENSFLIINGRLLLPRSMQSIKWLLVEPELPSLCLHCLWHHHLLFAVEKSLLENAFDYHQTWDCDSAIGDPQSTAILLLSNTRSDPSLGSKVIIPLIVRYSDMKLVTVHLRISMKTMVLMMKMVVNPNCWFVTRYRQIKLCSRPVHKNLFLEFPKKNGQFYVTFW